MQLEKWKKNPENRTDRNDSTQPNYKWYLRIRLRSIELGL